MYYIGLDVHKKTISYCVKDASGQVHQEGKVGATRLGTGRLDKDASPTPDGRHGSNHFHRLDLRSFASACHPGESGTSPDAARHRSRQEEERPQAERIKRLRTVPGVGPITALTWALEMGDVSRFRSIRQAISYCGLCGDEKSSTEKVTRTPLSKQRNKHIQRVLVEAAKLAPRQDHTLALVYEREKQKGNANRATLAVARKMVAYLLAVDRGQRDFVPFADLRSVAA
jgi:hypothetical protein